MSVRIRSVFKDKKCHLEFVVIVGHRRNLPLVNGPICMICVIPILIKNVSELCYALKLSSSDKTVSDSITEISFLQI